MKLKQLLFLGNIIFLCCFLSCDKEGMIPEVSVSSVGVFDSLAIESSGLLVFDNQCFTHNDGGDAARLFEYELNTTNFERKIKIKGAHHIDWEDLAADDEYIYIGDFGNNSGAREDLKIYKVPHFDSMAECSDSASIIHFHFQDQIDFDFEYNAHDFDCEAIIVLDNEIYLFSKNLLNHQCKIYRLPNTAGTHEAELLHVFDTKGLITGATINEAADAICLSGFNRNIDGNYEPFIWIIQSFTKPNFWEGQKQKIDLPILAKIEGISFKADNNELISSEYSQAANGGIYEVNISDFLE